MLGNIVPKQNATYTADNPPFEVDQDLKEFLPPLEGEVFESLVKSIEKEGVRENLLCWKEGDKTYLIDGHNRFRASQETGKPFGISYIEGIINREEIVQWMVDNQLSRRNMTPAQMKQHWGKIYNLKKGKRGGDRSNRQNDGLQTAKFVATLAGVSERTIERWAKISEAEKQATAKQKSDEEVANAFVTKWTKQFENFINKDIDTEAKRKALEEIEQWMKAKF